MDADRLYSQCFVTSIFTFTAETLQHYKNQSSDFLNHLIILSIAGKQGKD